MCKIVDAEDGYFLILKRNICMCELQKQIVNNTGMRKDSFADRYVIRIMNNLLNGAINLREKYETYYLDEYQTFQEFLFKKELLNYDFIETIFSSGDIDVYRLKISQNDYSVENVIGYEKENLQYINQLIGTVTDEI